MRGIPPILSRTAALAVVLAAPTANALKVESGALGTDAVFGIAFPSETRAYYARADAVRSVSLQSYITSAFKVVELNVVTEGPALMRVYHSRALKPGELEAAMRDSASAAGAGSTPQPLPPSVRQMAERAANATEPLTGDTVTKSYPAATHAHTVEYRVRSRGELLELFAALRDHWLEVPVDTEGGADSGDSRSLGGTLFTVEK